jgi:signal transduction histidine kinase
LYFLTIFTYLLCSFLVYCFFLSYRMPGRYNTLIFIVFLIMLASGVNSRAQVKEVDSAKAVFQGYAENDTAYIKTCFFIADSYMDIEQYDSAQIWLNKIHRKLPLKKPSLFNYFLITRQAEVYYYNNLQQLGLQESFKGLRVAQSLNDSLLLADSYNFLGLFYMNLDSSKQAVHFYNEGLKYTRQPPYPAKYLSLTKPHHLYGNMSEAYYNMKMYDSALSNIRRSLQKANEINWGRGIAVGNTSAGDIFLALQNTDSAFSHYKTGKLAAKQSNDIDVELLCYGGMARCFERLYNYPAMYAALDTGFVILKKNASLNRFFALQFLNTATGIYKEKNETGLLAHALEIKSAIQIANIKSNNSQIQTILTAGVDNEKRLLSLEVTEAKQKQKLANTRLIMVVIAFALMAAAFFGYRYFQRQKMKLAKMRQKISQDLHDDIGASLSSLQIYGAIAEKTIADNPVKAMEMVGKISRQSKLLMENMGDIVWSMNTAAHNSTSLETRIKNFVAELLEDKNIDFSYTIGAALEAQLQNMKARKNILLIIKEAFNNTAKYSGASVAKLQLEIKDKNLLLHISDNGKGFDTKLKVNGNGLENIKARTEELKGRVVIKSATGEGVNIDITIPLAVINNIRG